MSFDIDNSIYLQNENSNKQRIFDQIDQDVLSQKQAFSFQQNTKSNYAFVFLLDIVALLCALSGAVYLYSIFQKQEINLVSGYSGIKILESSLLDEINKQYQQELLEKERQLEELSSQLQILNSRYESILAQIRRDSQLKIENQRNVLQQELQKQLYGKTQSEQEELKRRFEEQISNMIVQINNEQLRSEEDERQKITQLQEDKIEQEKSLTEFYSNRNDLVINSSTVLSNSKKIKNTKFLEFSFLPKDRAIIQKFDQLEMSLSNKQYLNSISLLKDIEKFYISNNIGISDIDTNIPSLSLIKEWLKLLQNYIKLDTTVQKYTLLTQNLEQFNRRYQSGIDNNGLNTYIDFLKNNEPAVVKFALNYNDKLSLSSDSLIENNIKRAEDFLQIGNYKDAVKIYYDLLSMENISVRYRKMIISNLFSFDNEKKKIITKPDVSIPNELKHKVQKILIDETLQNNKVEVKYLLSPDGYVLDILQSNLALVVLTPGKRVKKYQKLNLYRVVDNSIQIERVGTIAVSDVQKSIVKTTFSDIKLRVGDLVYIK